MADNQLRANHTQVNNLAQLISKGEFGLANIPLAVKNVLEGECWKERELPTGKIVRFDSFRDFVECKPMDGLGIQLDELATLAKLDINTLETYDKVSVQPHGGNRNPSGVNQHTRKPALAQELDFSEKPAKAEMVKADNVSLDHEVDHGNSPQYALRRLRNQAPELHTRVLAKELSPHAAMIQAGFRRKTITVPLDVTLAANCLKRHFDRESLRQIINLLGDEQ